MDGGHYAAFAQSIGIGVGIGIGPLQRLRKKNFYGPLNPVGFYPERGMSNMELFNDLKPYYSKEAILACINDPKKDDRNRIIRLLPLL